jgi:hypothetical protein
MDIGSFPYADSAAAVPRQVRDRTVQSMLVRHAGDRLSRGNALIDGGRSGLRAPVPAVTP